MNNCEPTPPQCPPGNPCTCIGVRSQFQPTPPPCPLNNCLVLCDIVILSKDGVGPCGQSGTIDLMDSSYNHDFTVCEGSSINWSFISVEGYLPSVKVTPDGILTWITGDSSSAGKYSTITLKACCGEYASYMDVIVGVKDLCNCPGCNQCETCDPCTGDCLSSDVQTSLNNSRNLTNTTTNGK